MQCPFCGRNKDKVIDSRSAEGGKAVRRRRVCLECHKRYTTYEKIEDAIRLTVAKKDGSREPYSRGKLIAGLQRACYKRPISEEQIRQIVENVEEQMFRKFEKEVPSEFIGDAVADVLRNADKIAYVRYASVYRDFRDVGELIKEAQEAEYTPVISPEQKGLFDNKSSNK